MPQWTEEQENAILAREKNILVSAAAGSGKTAVLTERIVKKLTDPENPLDASKLLVVTFTSAAASEMRERIVSKLTKQMEENPESELIRKQLALIDTATIATIHSFCLNMIRENFLISGVDPAFKIADPTQSSLIKKEAIDETIDEMFEDEIFSEGFLKLCENYGSIRGSGALFELINKIYDFVMSLPDPEGWLIESADEFSENKKICESKYVKIALKDAKEVLKSAVSKYNALIKKAEIDDDVPEVLSLLKAEATQIKKALSCEDYHDFYNFVSSLSFADFPRARKGFLPVWREYIKDSRDKIKKLLCGLLKEKYFNLTEDELEEVKNELYPSVLALSETVRRVIKKFGEKKAKKNILDFNDLEHICYRLFVDENGNKTEIATKTGERFCEILIDEYQDTSRLQESIFASIGEKSHTFTVGDIKQSIYRFRNTDPLLFRNKCDTFLKEENSVNRKILLTKNFRSRKNVLLAINYIFSRIMSREAGEVDYTDDEKLNFGANFSDSVNPLDDVCEINIIDRAMEVDDSEEETEEISTAEIEAELIADRISELILSGYEVKDNDKMRPITYRDICVLLRATKNADILTTVLSERGIPVFADSASGFFEAGEVDTVLSFLKIVDNPYQDIPLLAVLRSPVYNFTTNDLARIRAEKKDADFFDCLVKMSAKQEDELGKRISSFLKELSRYRLRAKTISTHEFLWEFYLKSGFYDYAGAEKNGKLKQANLRSLYVRAAEYDKTGFKGLYSFVSFLEEYKGAGSDFATAKLIGEEMNVVRIMSIHKSKGLEFPVVILGGCGKEMNMQDSKGSFLFHPELGYGPKYVDGALRITYPTVIKTAVAAVIKNECISEEMRILYVALTRAKEKLILTGSVRNLTKAVLRWRDEGNGQFKFSPHSATSAKSYFDWIGMCLINHPDGKLFAEYLDEQPISFEDSSRFKINILPAVAVKREKIEENVKAEETRADTDEIIKLIKTEYAHKDEVGIPSKITVTELKRKLAEEEKEGHFLYKKTPVKEDAGTTISAAKRGIAFHTVMEHIDFSETVDDFHIKLTAQKLYEQGYLDEEELGSIDEKKLSLFFKSDLYKMVKDAKEVHREVMFAIKEKASDLGIAKSDAKVLIQGVIDLCLVYDDGIFIVDYKTDKNITPSDAAKRYRVQLICYAMAVKKLFGKSAKKAYLYLFENGEFGEVDLTENLEEKL